MQVNSNVQTPNFGMALRIKPAAMDSLKSATRSQLENLEKIGEKLKDTKFYHLEIGENGERMVVSPWANRYKGGSFDVIEPVSGFLCFRAKWEGANLGRIKKGDISTECIKFANTEAAKSAYAAITSVSGIERDAKMIKYLDERAIVRVAEEKAARTERNTVAAMADKLIATFGVE